MVRLKKKPAAWGHGLTLHPHFDSQAVPILHRNMPKQDMWASSLFCSNRTRVSSLGLAIMRYWAGLGPLALFHDRSSEDNLARNPAGRARPLLGRAGDTDDCSIWP